jgi:N-acetylmuramoyl-L-alanine amidase
MYHASAVLIRDLCTRWSIPIDRDHVIAHHEIYAMKPCPGPSADLDRLVCMARDAALVPERYNFVAETGRVRTCVALRVRRGVPSTATETTEMLPAGREIEYVGWTSNGTSVNANAHWYRDQNGNYFWAGGTEKAFPGT